MSVMMIAIAGKGSLLRNGTRAWYVNALFDALRKNDGLLSGSLTIIDEGREVAIATKVSLRDSTPNARKKSNTGEGWRRCKEWSSGSLRSTVGCNGA
jgi:hypothetical protein